MPTSDLHNIVPILTVFGSHVRSRFSTLAAASESTAYSCASTWTSPSNGSKGAIGGFASKVSTLSRTIETQSGIRFTTRYTSGIFKTSVPTLAPYDAILIADMIEHLEKPAATKLVRQLHQLCGTLVISTPKRFYPQPSTNGNDFEIHRCLWTQDDYPEGINVVSISGLEGNVYVSSRQPIDKDAYRPAAALDVVFLQSRDKLRGLGRVGWPVSAALRALGRLVT